MVLESHGRDHRPFFGALTFHPRHYHEESPKFVLEAVQKLWKVRRKAGAKLRYFVAIERGSKKGRLHAHYILWDRELSKLSDFEAWQTMHLAWGKGRTTCSRIRGVGGIHYTAKYILKDLGEHIDRKTGEIRRCRNFTYSNKPRFGDPGLTRWEYLIDQLALSQTFSRQNLPISWFNMNFNGKMVKVHIPSSQWKAKAKALGIDLTPVELDVSITPEQIYRGQTAWREKEAVQIDRIDRLITPEPRVMVT